MRHRNHWRIAIGSGASLVLHLYWINQPILIADASAAGTISNNETVIIVLAMSAVAIGVTLCLIRQYRRAVLENRVRAVRELEEQYRECKSRAESILARAKSEGRDFSPFESREFGRLMDEFDELQTELKQARRRAPAPEVHRQSPQRQSNPNSAVEGLLFLQLLTMLSPCDRDRHNRR